MSKKAILVAAITIVFPLALAGCKGRQPNKATPPAAAKSELESIRSQLEDEGYEIDSRDFPAQVQNTSPERLGNLEKLLSKYVRLSKANKEATEEDRAALENVQRAREVVRYELEIRKKGGPRPLQPGEWNGESQLPGNSTLDLRPSQPQQNSNPPADPQALFPGVPRNQLTSEQILAKCREIVGPSGYIGNVNGQERCMGTRVRRVESENTTRE